MFDPVSLIFVPFLGDFFSIVTNTKLRERIIPGFRPLSRGLFFNRWNLQESSPASSCSFRPLSRGLFFNYTHSRYAYGLLGFRPLSRGLFFNAICHVAIVIGDAWFSSPFSGTFFQFSGIRS